MQLKRCEQIWLFFYTPNITVRNTGEVFSECSVLKNSSSVPKPNMLLSTGLKLEYEAKIELSEA